jgi:hypothetical protein
LHDEARDKVNAGRSRVLDSDDFARLKPEAELRVRLEFLSRGQSLEEVADVPLHTEEDLLAATAAVPIPLLRAKRDGVAQAVAQALARAAALGAESPELAPMTWPTSRLSGKLLRDQAEVDHAFDAAKDEIKALIRQGKSVRTV